MSRRYASWAILCVLIGVAVFGCSCTPQDLQNAGKAKSTSARLDDGAGVAVAAAQARMESVAGDAVPVMVTTPGVALAPPPEQWSVMFAVPSNGRTYTVAVSHGQAEAPRDVGPLRLSKTELDSAVDYGSLKVGSDEAYAKAKAELAKTGAVPPQAMEGVTLVKMAALPQFKQAVWQVSFLNGTSAKGMRQADVDAMTGAVTETK